MSQFLPHLLAALRYLGREAFSLFSLSLFCLWLADVSPYRHWLQKSRAWGVWRKHGLVSLLGLLGLSSWWLWGGQFPMGLLLLGLIALDFVVRINN